MDKNGGLGASANVNAQCLVVQTPYFLLTIRKVLTWVSIAFGRRAQGLRGANDFAAQNH